MITSEQAIALVQTHATRAINHYRSVNKSKAGSPALACRKEEQSVRALLKALLDREPTEEEVNATLA